MSNSVVLVDFGATRVKAALWSLRSNSVVTQCESPAPLLSRGAHGEVEGNPEHYWQAFEETVGRLIEADSSIKDIFICSEMHGYMLADPVSFNPLTKYISWQDQRFSSKLSDSGAMSADAISLDRALVQEAGMRLRPGLPIASASQVVAEVNPAHPLLFLTLVDWLLVRGGDRSPKCHPTLAAGTGFYSLNQMDWSQSLAATGGVNHGKLVFPSIQKEFGPIGFITLMGQSFRVWGGLGDLQAAALGAGFPKEGSIFFNLGTGSQVLALLTARMHDMEVRPCATGELAHALTHIPAGRALNLFARFVDECSLRGGGQPIFWESFYKLDASDVLASDPCIDLNVFSAAWRYKDGGSIVRITENFCDLQSFLCSLANSWLKQYSAAIGLMSHSLSSSYFILSGGLSRRATFIPFVLESLTGLRGITKPLRTGEETLDGLLHLAESTIQ